MTNTSKALFQIIFVTTLLCESVYKAGKFSAPYIKQFYAYVMENAPYWWVQTQDYAKIAKPYVIQGVAYTLTGLTYVKDFSVKVWANRETIREAVGSQFVYRCA
jgi:hypothetical protein